MGTLTLRFHLGKPWTPIPGTFNGTSIPSEDPLSPSRPRARSITHNLRRRGHTALTRFGALGFGAVPAALRPCSAESSRYCAPVMFNPLGTPLQTEFGTPNDWPFLGAWRFFPSGPTSLPVKESAAGAGPARPPPPPPVTCPQAPCHRNDLWPRLARNRSP